MISNRWLAFLVAGTIALATPAIAAAAPAQAPLPPAQVRLAYTLGHFTKAQFGQMQRNVAALNRERQTYQASNPPAAKTHLQGRSRSSRRRTRASPLTYRVTCSSAPTATFDPTPLSDPNWDLEITAHYDLVTSCFGGQANRGEPTLGRAGVVIYETDTVLPPIGAQGSSAANGGVDHAAVTGSAQGPQGRWQNLTQVTLALPRADVWTFAEGGLCAGIFTSVMTCYTNNEYGITLA